MKRAFWWGLETLTGDDPSWWTPLKVHSKERGRGGGWMKRKEQTCQDRAKTWQLGSRSANESMGKGDSIHFTRLHESKRQHASTAKHQQKCSC